MESSAEETPCMGTLFLPPEMIWAVLSFLEGRSLTKFETAARSTKQAVQDSPDLYKTLLLRQIDNVPQMASLPSKEGKRALMTWEAGDFQPVHALASLSQPYPRYLHRMAEAGDGWTYLHGGHLESGLSDEVWRFRVSESRGHQGTRAKEGAVKLQWEKVWGGNEEELSEDSGSTSAGDAQGNEQHHSEGGAVDGNNWPPPPPPPPPPVAAGEPPADDDDVLLYPEQGPEAPQEEVPGLGFPLSPVVALAAAPLPGFHAALAAHGVLGVAFEDAAGVDAAQARQVDSPRPRCAASWTWKSGSNKIYLFGGQGSDSDFLGDLWCFHAGGRGECRWERLDSTGEPRRRDAAAVGEEEGDSDHDHDHGHDEQNEEGLRRGPGRVPEGRWGHTMVEHEGFLYMFGGSSPGKAYAGLWRLDTSVSPCVWSLVTPDSDMAEVDAGRSGRPAARGGHSATVVRNSLYIFGGNITEDVFKDLWVVDLPDCKAWRRVQETPEFPPARIGHSAVALGGRILIFGGRSFNTGVFTGGLSCFDVDLQAFVGFPHAEAFSRDSRRGGGMWGGLKMTGHAAVHCSRGLLIVGGLLPRGLPSTMSAWTLDVVQGCRGRRQRRRRRSVDTVTNAIPGGCAQS